MTYRLTCRIIQKHRPDIWHEFLYFGNTKEEALAQIDTQPQHKHNLKHYGKTSFKSTDGAKHEWRLEALEH